MLDLSNVEHHPALTEIVDVLVAQTDQTDRGFFQAEVAYFLGKLASSMRAVIVTKDRGEIPVNIYTLALATSGFGKGHSIGILENEILAGFRRRYMEDTFGQLAEASLWEIANNRAARNSTDQNEEFEKVQKEFRSLGSYPFTFDSGTPPAVKQLRDKLLMSGSGSINLQIDEIGSNLIGSVDVLNVFLELYDQGMVKTKLIKNTIDNQRVEQLEGKTPTNMLLFGTPAKLFDGGQTEDQFYSFLETGYARRCIFGYGIDNRANHELSPEQLYFNKINSANRSMITKWGIHFEGLADPTMFKWKMVVEDEVAIKLLEYKIDCERQAKLLPEHEEIKKAELSHRYFKALKLAGAYAFVDVSTEVEMDHLLSAIKLVEESGEAFFKILNRDKAYVKLAKYIANCGTEVTHADLTESLPFYPKSQGPRNDMMLLATSWGYKKNMIIKKSFVDGIEFFKGETLQETDLSQCLVSYSTHWAYNFVGEKVPFDQLHVLTQADGFHWTNHHFKGDHRSEENAIPGFNLVAIDVDEGIHLHTVHELMKDYKFLTYTTKRHTPEHNRFRLILPINYFLELDNSEYKEFMRSVFSWLPFKTDESSEKREKKWESFSGGTFHYNLEGELLDATPFIPKTSRNEGFKNQTKDLQSLDSLERWFAQRIASGNRNNHMIKYALALVDSGWDLHTVMNQVRSFNAKLNEPLSDAEVDSTIAVTVAKRYQTL